MKVGLSFFECVTFSVYASPTSPTYKIFEDWPGITPLVTDYAPAIICQGN